jgi:hypothetical protein
MLLLLGLVAVVSVCRRLSIEDRNLLQHGVTAVGLLVAMTGWLGVAGRIRGWAWLGDGIWRASSTVSYPNATAVVLVVVAVSVLGRLTEAPRQIPSLLAATGLLAGAGATMSRAGVLGLAVGVIVLAVLRGARRTVRAATGPAAGALFAVACLLPSMPASGPTRPVLAAVGLLGGLALAAVVGRLPGRPAAVLLCMLAVAGLGLLLAGGRGSGGALATVSHARANLASPDRGGAVHAAIGVIHAHPVTGAGAGHADLRWEGPDGVLHFYVYAHNEYVQTTAELGLVGAMLLAVLLAALARLLWSARAATGRSAAWAGAVGATAAFAVHSGFDFIWHLPAVVLTVLLISGAVLPGPAGTSDPGASRRSRRETDEIQATK